MSFQFSSERATEPYATTLVAVRLNAEVNLAIVAGSKATTAANNVFPIWDSGLSKLYIYATRN
jgi:hypothetical protein